MANVLGELFGDIANAIREKTGDTATMKPAEFPSKINGIEVGGGSGGEIIDGVDPYYQDLAQALITRNAEYLSEDPTILPMKGFVTSTGGVLATVAPYAFAGFKDVEKITISDTLFVNPYAFAGNKKLKIIDITAPRFNTGSVAFYGNSLYECSALQSVIVRDGGIGLEYVNFFKNDMSGADYGGVGANDTFCVYIPSAYYDSVVANVNAATNIAVPTSRYRKLEDYPAINNWNKTFTVNFYDGDKLVESKTVMYGQTASSSYSKSNYRLVGWNPEPVNVMEDMDCYGTWVPINFSDASWEEIAEVANAGKMSEFYKVGDEKNATLTYADGTTEDITFVIAGFAVGDLEGGTKSNVALVTKNALKTKQKASTAYNRYLPNQVLDKYVNETVYAALPEALKVAVKKKEWNSYGWNPTYRYCWTLDLTELGITNATNFSASTSDCTPFPLFVDAASRIKCLGGTTTAVEYWTASDYSSTGTSMSCAVINTDGSWRQVSISDSSKGVVFGVCL